MERDLGKVENLQKYRDERAIRRAPPAFDLQECEHKPPFWWYKEDSEVYQKPPPYKQDDGDKYLRWQDKPTLPKSECERKKSMFQ